eukprot:2711467-Amphidinium_carterae.1
MKYQQAPESSKPLHTKEAAALREHVGEGRLVLRGCSNDIVAKLLDSQGPIPQAPKAQPSRCSPHRG